MELDLNRVLQIIRRWWWLLLLAPLIGGGTAWYVSERQQEMYESSVTLLVGAGVSTTNAGSVQASQNLTETYSQWAVTRPVLERTAQVLAWDGTVEELDRAVSARTVPDTLFIEILAQSSDPAEAATIANTVAEQFLLDVQDQTAAQSSQVRSNLNLQIEDTSSRLAEVQDRIGTLQDDANRTDTEREEIARLLNEEVQLQADLAQFETTIRTIDVEIATDQPRIVVLSPAIPPQEPFAPNTMRATLIGAVSGMALAITAAIVLEYLDDTIRDREELGRIASTPVLASIAVSPGARRGTSPLFVLDHPTSASAEAMRLLRANLEFASAPDRLNTLAISSPQPNEGKSTITANLGVVLAQAGLKTVIIDADLRHPSQHRIFGVPNRQGLSTMLVTPDPDWRQGLTSLTIPNLSLLPSGPIPPNPADLLSLDRFTTILAAIEDWADVVLIDTPPLLAASDAVIAATTARGLLMVCRHGLTRRGTLRRSIVVLEHAHARLMGTVLNDTRSDGIDHYGRYGDEEQGSQPRSSYYFRSGPAENGSGMSSGQDHPRQQTSGRGIPMTDPVPPREQQSAHIPASVHHH